MLFYISLLRLLFLSAFLSTGFIFLVYFLSLFPVAPSLLVIFPSTNFINLLYYSLFPFSFLTPLLLYLSFNKNYHPLFPFSTSSSLLSHSLSFSIIPSCLLYLSFHSNQHPLLLLFLSLPLHLLRLSFHLFYHPSLLLLLSSRLFSYSYLSHKRYTYI